MVYFTAKGHPNILASHKNTFEFTKDKEISQQGDCIVGVEADFLLEELQQLSQAKKLTITIECAGLREEIQAFPNLEFCDAKELVVRIGEFCSPRTFAVRADKAAKDFSQEMKAAMQKKENRINVRIEP